MVDAEVLNMIDDVFEDAGDTLPRDETETFWRGLAEGTARFIEDRDPEAYKRDVSDLYMKFTSKEAPA